MVRLPFLKRSLPPGARMTARSHLFPGPKILLPALPYNPLTTYSFHLPGLNCVFARRRSIHNAPEGTQSEGENLGWKRPKIYRNKYGEEMVLDEKDVPPEYTFVPSGVPFVTRECRKECRKLAHKIFVKYRPQSRKKHTAHLGLYVPNSVSAKVESELKRRRVAVDKNMWRKFDKKYPYIPSADRSKLYGITSAERCDFVGKAALKHQGINIYSYVLDRYTPLNSLCTHSMGHDRKAVLLIHEEAEKILASWSGEDQTSLGRLKWMTDKMGSAPRKERRESHLSGTHKDPI